MLWLIKNLLLSITLTGTLLWLIFSLLKKIKGIKATQELLSPNLTRFLVVIVSVLVFRLVFGIYGLLVAWFFLTILSAIWLVSWPLRKLKAGKVLCKIHQPKLPKSAIWVNLLVLSTFGPTLWSTLWLASKTIPTGYLVNPVGLSFYLFLVTFLFLPSYLAMLEGPSFRTNGICSTYKFIPWDRVDSYSLNSVSQGILMLYWRPYIPIFSRGISLPITSAQVDAIKNILDEHLKS